ncbi:O-antigen polymerase [Thermanaeromonas sp. C210]|uniref:O-antigen polymerase n=1 Tax=Thermanaeromonas sp. C210 TaxID=2731925 RepID=UPI00155C42E9|nr:O-antigen polymerase [Thermanaeromonas sp. C210]GFN23661.1 hypothetical protein TAMC210_19780 [Thermanaeromonas sp. C210]
MSEIILTFFAAVMIVSSWIATNHFFNPLGIYTFVWYIGLLAATLNWVGFKEIDPYGWIMIAISYFAFALGFFTIVLAHKVINSKYSNKTAYAFYNARSEINKIRKLTFLFCMAAAIGICYEWLGILSTYGGFSGFIKNANLIYSERIEGRYAFSIPYLSSFALAASALAGVQIALTRQFTFLNIFPLILVFLSNLASMSRAGIFMALGLYITPYLILANVKLGKKKNKLVIKKTSKLVIVVLLISLVVFMGTNFIRDIRGGIESYSVPQSDLLNFLQKTGLFRPSLYVYVGGPPIAFAESLKMDRDVLGRGEIPGTQTFAPFFRLLSKFGLSTYVSYYEEFVDIGIREMNTGTYLKDVYIDFGIPGVVIFPYLLGLFVTFLYQHIRRKPNILCLTAVSFLYLYIEMSAIMNIFRLGYYVISFAVALAGIILIKPKESKKFSMGSEHVEFSAR